MENPDRFNVRPTLGELSTRKPLPPPHDMTTSEKSDLQDQGKTNEPLHEKTNILHMQKQRRRSASR